MSVCNVGYQLIISRGLLWTIFPGLVLLHSHEEDTSEYDEFRPSWDVPPLPIIRFLFPSFVHKTVQAVLISLTLTSYVSWSLLKSIFLPLDDPSGSESSVKQSSQQPRGPRSLASRHVSRSEKYIVKPYFRHHELAESASAGFGHFRTVFTRLASIWIVYKSYILVNEVCFLILGFSCGFEQFD